MRERIAVLGSNSFSGSHFVDHCLDEGLSVLGISRSTEPNPVYLPYKSNRGLDRFRFAQLDLNHDIDRIESALREFQPQLVVNFAAQGMVAESWQHPEHWFQTNTVANIVLHDRLRKMPFLQKYVHVSTPEVYGSMQGLVKESTAYNPSTPYATSRAATDLSLMTFFRAYQFPVVFTRAANVFGPGQQLYRIIPRSILFPLLGKKLALHGGGRSIRSFISIRDVVRGTLRVARNGKPGEIFHFSTTENISIREVVELILRKLGRSFEDSVAVTEDRLGKDAAYLLDSAKARSLGWSPDVSLEAEIDNCIRWVRDNLGELKRLPHDYVHKR